jgi:hypothetical protein
VRSDYKDRLLNKKVLLQCWLKQLGLKRQRKEA